MDVSRGYIHHAGGPRRQRLLALVIYTNGSQIDTLPLNTQKRVLPPEPESCDLIWQLYYHTSVTPLVILFAKYYSLNFD